jgi:hypothetical protein
MQKKKNTGQYVLRNTAARSDLNMNSSLQAIPFKLLQSLIYSQSAHIIYNVTDISRVCYYIVLKKLAYTPSLFVLYLSVILNHKTSARRNVL